MKTLNRFIKNREVVRGGVSFLIAFVLIIVYTNSLSMVYASGDANSIWGTIKSFFSEKVIGSYVLYKGFASVYPYVWLYQLSLLFETDQFTFVKIYHAILFAYSVSLGFPYLISKLIKVEVRLWRNILLIFMLFWVWKFTYALDQLMVDLPSLAYFLLAINTAIKANNFNGNKKLFYYIISGLLIGLVNNISGQYILAGYSIVIYIIYRNLVLLKQDRKKRLLIFTILPVICLILSVGSISVINSEFESSVVDKLRSEGEWIPSKNMWMVLGIFNFDSKTLFPDIPDNLGIAIRNEAFGEDYDVYKIGFDEKLGQAPQLYIPIYINLVLKYPVEFIVRFFDRFFIAISPENNNLNIPMLILDYTALFVLLLKMRSIKKLKDFFSPNLFLWVSFVLAIVPPIVMHMELRYAIQIQGLIFSVFILDDVIWEKMISLIKNISSKLKDKTWKNGLNLNFNPVFIYYIIFIIVCFSYIGSLHEIIGPVASRLTFHW
jgi:hypothetical protein